MNKKTSAAIGGLVGLALSIPAAPYFRAAGEYLAGRINPITEEELTQNIERRVTRINEEAEHQQKLREIRRTAYSVDELSVSEEGREYIKQKEDFESEPYLDGAQFSVGYGSRMRPGENIRFITKEEAEERLDRDLEWVEDTIKNTIEVPLTQEMYDAMASFVYNVGGPQFTNSTLLRKLNEGDYAGAASQFSSWVKSNGRVEDGLVNRRQEEKNMFLHNIAIGETGEIYFHPALYFNQEASPENQE